MDAMHLLLTGALPFVTIAAVVVGVPAAALLLRAYRRRVLRLMSRGAVPLAPDEAVPHATSARLEELSASGPTSTPGALSTLRGRERRLMLAEVVAGLAATLVMTGTTLLSAGLTPLPVRTAVVVGVCAWPVLITLLLAHPGARRRALRGGVLYALLMAVLTALAVGIGGASVLSIVSLWLIVNAAPSVLLLIALARPVRAVGPMVVAFCLACFVGAVLALSVLAGSDGLMRGLAVVSLAGLGAQGALLLAAGLGIALFAGIGWFALRWLGRGHAAGRLGDRELVLASVWLLFSLWHGMRMSFEGLGWVLSGLLVFLVYAGLARGLAVLWAGRTEASPGLLVLRVFSLGRRSESLFREVATRWRHLGPVRLIAGPDLATTTVDPDEFLDFLAGNLAARFVDARAAGSESLTAPAARGRDGRHRVQEFFCFGDTWERVLARLVRCSEVVLMDLRSFSPANAGCVRELVELSRHMPMERVVLVVDDTTDREFLARSLGTGAGGGGLTARLFELRATSADATEALTAHLAASIPACSPQAAARDPRGTLTSGVSPTA